MSSDEDIMIYVKVTHEFLYKSPIIGESKIIAFFQRNYAKRILAPFIKVDSFMRFYYCAF